MTLPRLLYVTTRYGAESGEADGGSVFASQAIPQLSICYDVDVLSLQTKPAAEYHDLNGVRTVHWLAPNLQIENRFERRFDTAKRMREWASTRSNVYDVIVLQHVSSGFGLPDSDLDTKVIVFPMYTGVAYLRSGERISQEYLAAERAVFANATGVVCASKAEASEIVTSYGVNATRLAVVPFAVNLNVSSSCLPNPSGVLTLLTIGAIKPQKNQVDALEVLQYLRDHFGIQTQLLLAGKVADEAYYSHLCQEIRRRKLRHAVTYCGVLAHSEVGSFISRGHFCLSVSRWETFGIAVMEALSMGVPVLAYDDIDCFWEYLDHDRACMGVPRQPYAMAEKIASVWSNPADYVRRSRAAQREVAIFGEVAVWSKMRSTIRRWVS